jgi:O-antigen ligase
MTADSKILQWLFAALLMIAAALAVYFQQLLLLCIPFAVLMGCWLVQYPEYLFYLLIAAIPWSVEFNITTALGTDLPDEPLMLLTTFSTIVWMINRRQPLLKRGLHPLLFLLILQWVWSLLILFVSTDFVHSFKFVLAKSWYLLAFVGTPLLLWQDMQKLKRTVVVLLVSMMLVVMVVMIRHGINGFSFEKINPSLEPFFRNHVNYSSLLVCMVPLLVAVYLYTSSKKSRYLVLLMLVITIAALILSYARGSWLALLAGILAYWLIRKRLLVFSFLLIITLSVASVFWLQSNDRFLNYSSDYRTTIFHTNFEEHLVATYKLKDMSTAERFYRWVAGIRMTKDSWQTGFGPNTFYDNYKSYALPAFKTWVSKNEEHSTVHNYFLLQLIEQGIIGLLLFVSVIVTLLWYAQAIYHRTSDRFWKIAMACTAAILFMLCVINFLSDMIETDKVGSVFYLCVAAIIIADYKTKQEMQNVKLKM